MKKFINIIKIIVVIILIIVLFFIGNLIYKKIMLNKFVNMLNQNNSSNYTLVQNDGETTTTIKVKNDVFVSEDDESYIWISETENIRVVMDKNSKIAIITENPEEDFEVSSLNSSYINEYFENSSLKFKYLGKEENLYKVQFTNTDTETITIFYIDSEIGIITQIDETINGTEFSLNFEVTFDNVTDEEVEYPDLEEYNVGVSSSSS